MSADKRRPASPAPYPPIGDYGFIGDCHAVALVSRGGAIDWCCVPRIDSPSCFGRLLDWDHGGHCTIAPVAADATVTRAYLEASLVLETRVHGEGGEVRLLDFFAMRAGGRTYPRRQLIRIVEGVRGAVDLAIVLAARFDYGSIRPWIRSHGAGLWTAIGGDAALVISTDVALAVHQRHDLRAAVTVAAGERLRLSIEYVEPQAVYPHQPARVAMAELDRRLDETLGWWRRWSSRATWALDGRDRLLRSAVVIKGLVHAPTGAIAAAATTSLPECVGAGRNWDYRHTWIRDSTFALQSLAELGFHGEAKGFHRFIERTTADDAGGLQVLYNVCGGHRLTEVELDGLAGYRDSRPVRIGNRASRQLQLDMYGDILDLAWRGSARGDPTGDEYWAFLCAIVEQTIARWSAPDHGIWEVRGAPRHFVYSKVMCWAALDRALKLATRERRDAPLERWAAARDAVRRAIDLHGHDRERGILVQSFGARDLDAALLLVPRVDFLAWDDPIIVRTTDAVREELGLGGGLLRRYRSDDGLAGREGAFLPCSFWLAECLAHQGRGDEAREVFDAVAGLVNDLGLFAEEYDPERREMLGNYPQGLTHYSYLSAAVALARIHGRGTATGPTPP